MQALTLPAARGWQWIAGGFRLFRANAPLTTFVVFGYLFALLAIDVIPSIGPLVASMCVPALSVVVMNGCRAIERKQAFSVAVLASGVRAAAPSMVTLGGFYLAGTLVVFAILALPGDGALLRALREAPAENTELLRSQFALALQVAAAVLVPFEMAFWFAPMLAAWNGCGPVKALFFSFVACWRNWRPFLVYALGVGALSVAVPAALLAATAAISLAAARFLAGLLTVPLLFVFLPTMFASFYVSYREVFVEPATDDAQR